MAAYAALVSLMNVIDEIQLHHARHLISLDRVHTEMLRGSVSYLIDFLEACSERGSKEAEQLESSITKAAYSARFIIELDVTENISQFYVGDRIFVPSRSCFGMNSSPLNRGVKRVIREIVSIRVRAEIIKSKTPIKDAVKLDLNVFEFKSSIPSSPMVGFDEFLIRILDGLTKPQPNRQIIPITGMGGIGKTTLAKNVYDHPMVVQYFDIRAWVTISQECSITKVLLGVLYCLRKEEVGESLDAFIGNMSQTGEGQLGEQLHKILFGRRYLIIMDDMWSVDIWNNTKNYFPDNSNGSRVIVTTRLSNLANDFGACGIEMNFLDEDKSWKLLSEKVFDKERCPLELEEIGKKIANKCNGLPLSLVVIGGLLAKSTKTLEYWEAVASDVNAIVNSQDDCLKILSLSYNHLPVHLKPCFLYIGVLRVTRVSELTKSWVAEGFIKPVRTKSLEEVANEYLKDLIDRNLIMVHEWGSSGKMKTCNMHDLLRDLSLRNAEKEKFISCRVSQSHSNVIIWSRRVALGSFGSVNFLKLISKSIPPSAFGYMTVLKDTLGKYFYELQEEDKYYLRLVCSRYFEFTQCASLSLKFPTSLHLLWNLQTLVLDIHDTVIAPVEIWELKQLRHVKSRSLVLPDPPPSGGGRFNVMENLQSLSIVRNLKCSEEVLKRIPNIQKLQLTYYDLSKEYVNEALHCLNNFGRLEKLKSLGCSFYPPSWRPDELPIMWQSWCQLWQKLTFSSSLMKLSMHGTYLLWEDMTMIGSLPHLEVLKLKCLSFIGSEWNPVEGEFPSLKFLEIAKSRDLLYWGADSTHFPSLTHLVLRSNRSLKEIPMDIGEIPTLRSIKLYFGLDSIVISAKNILDEQLSYGNEDIRVEVLMTPTVQRKLDISTSKNFLVHIGGPFPSGSSCRNGGPLYKTF